MLSDHPLDAGSAFVGSLVTLVILGFWVIGSGLKHAAEIKKRRQPDPPDEA
jgi:hypothetical protein